MLEVYIDGRIIGKEFENENEVINFAEAELISKNDNVIISHDNITFNTIIEVLNYDCSETLHKISFYNPELEKDKKEDENLNELFFDEEIYS